MTYSISLTRTLLGVAACVSFASAFGAGSITINNVGCTLSQLTVDSSGNATATISGCTIASAGGGNQVTIPSVAGQSVAAATSTLTGAGFSVVGQALQASNTHAAGLVISTSPSGSAAAGSPITLFVSSGPPGGSVGADTAGWLGGTVIAGPNFWIVDQSGAGAGGGNTAVPGCVNQKQFGYSCPSSYGSSLNGQPYVITMGQGNVVSVRYRTGASVTPGYITLAGGSGSGTGIPSSATIALSSTPGDFAVDAKCTQTGPAGSTPRIAAGGSYCSVAPNSYYYLNIRTNSACTGGDCRFTDRKSVV